MPQLDPATSSTYVIPAHRGSYQSARQIVPSTSNAAQPSTVVASQDKFISRWGNGLIVATPDVSEDFIQKAIKTFREFPKPLQNLFQQTGCQFKLAKTLDQIFPEECKATPYFKSKGWQQSEGATVGRVVGLPEYIKPAGRTKFIPYTTNDKTLFAARHEGFHVVHNITDILFNDDGTINSEFEKAYTKDVAKLSTAERKKYEYYVRFNSMGGLDEKGMREICAETLAALHGGGSREDFEGVRKTFPRTTEYMTHAIKKILKQFSKI